MVFVKFKKLYKDAILPTPITPNSYRVNTSCLLRTEIRNGEKHYYLGTGAIAIQPNDHQLFIHPYNYRNIHPDTSSQPSDDISDVFRLVDDFGVILPEDRTEIIVHVRQIRPYSGDPELLTNVALAKLTLMPNTHRAYVSLGRYPFKNDVESYIFLRVNKNIPSLNYLTKAMAPIPPGSYSREYYEFAHLDTLYTEDSVQQHVAAGNSIQMNRRMKKMSYKFFEKVEKQVLNDLPVENVRDNDSDSEDEYSQQEIAKLLQHVLVQNGVEFLFKEKSIDRKISEYMIARRRYI